MNAGPQAPSTPIPSKDAASYSNTSTPVAAAHLAPQTTSAPNPPPQGMSMPMPRTDIDEYICGETLQGKIGV